MVSSRIVEAGTFESIHIDELTCSADETQIGDQEITADIPAVAMHKLAMLDENGVVAVGSYVRPGDILVGKVEPKAGRGGAGNRPRTSCSSCCLATRYAKCATCRSRFRTASLARSSACPPMRRIPMIPHVQEMLGRMERMQKLIMAENIRTFVNGKIRTVAQRGKIAYGEAKKLVLGARTLPVRLRELVTRERQNIANYAASEKDRVAAFMQRAAKNATIPKSNSSLKGSQGAGGIPAQSGNGR